MHSVNRVVPASEVIPTAVQLAKEVIQNSPDSVQTTKLGLLMAQKYDHDRVARENMWAPETTRLYHGDNIKVMVFLHHAQVTVTHIHLFLLLLCRPSMFNYCFLHSHVIRYDFRLCVFGLSGGS